MSAPTKPQRLRNALSDFLATEVAGGALLVGATVVALVVANSPVGDAYRDVLATEIGAQPFGLHLRHDVVHWVNDALMVLFFFVVGLEIKRELAVGELSDRRAAALPAVAALGGMVVPAVVFAIVLRGADGASGWGIPMATDIAFALGVLALLGDRVPPPLKLFLLTLAIVDDIGAILVIALFYGDGIAFGWLAAGVAALASMTAMRRAGVARIWPYLLPGAGLWLSLAEAGVHPTIAGVICGVLAPTTGPDGRDVIATLEDRLHPWSSFVVIPTFALANAGIEFSSDMLSAAWSSRLTWGIALGLILGKTLGILATTVAARRTPIGVMSSDITTRHIAGAASLGGIGFTVSLFVATLAFAGSDLLDEARVGILAGSLASAALGSVVLLGAHRRASIDA